MTIYASSREDYYPIKWNKSEYDIELNKLLSPNNTSFGVYDHHFIPLSLLGKVIQIVKGFFGFYDASDETRLTSELLKFFNYGCAQGWLPLDLSSKSWNVKHSHFQGSAIRSIFNELNSYNSKEGKLRSVRQIVVNYHQGHFIQLQPNFWGRLTADTVDTKDLNHFGDVALELAKKACIGKKPDVKLAIQHFFSAYRLQNLDTDFQKKFVAQFLSFLSKHRGNLAFVEKKAEIQEMLGFFADYSFRQKQDKSALDCITKLLEMYPTDDNVKQQIGEVFLEHQKFEDASPYISLIKKGVDNSNRHYRLAQFYHHTKQFKEALEAYKKALVHPTNEQREKQIRLEMGNLYINHLDSPAEAIEVLRIHDDQGAHTLLQAYFKQSEKEPASFESTYGKGWRDFIYSYPHLIKSHRAEFNKVTLLCLDQALKYKTGLDYIRNVFDRGHDDQFLCQIMDLYITYDSVKEFKFQFELPDTNSPVLLEKMSELIYKLDKEGSINYCEKAVKLHEKTPSSDTPKALSRLNTLLGLHFLNEPSGLLKKDCLPDAIKHLEIACKKDSTNEKARKGLSDAYIRKGDELKAKFIKDNKSAIEYYEKAFKTYPQNGTYLSNLIDLYLSSKDNNESLITLFENIQKQEWASKLELTAEQYMGLSRVFFSEDKYKFCVQCFEKAMSLDPKNQNYKKEIAEWLLDFADKTDDKVDRIKKIEDKISTLKIVLSCLNKGSKYAFEFDNLKEEYNGLYSYVYRRLGTVSSELIAYHVQMRDIPTKERREHAQKHATQVQEILQYYDQALKHNPKNAKVYFQKALIVEYFTMDVNFLQNAKELYKKALECDSTNPFYKKCLAIVYEALHEESEIDLTLPKDISFETDFMNWQSNLFSETKEYEIDPYQYAIEDKFSIKGPYQVITKFVEKEE